MVGGEYKSRYYFVQLVVKLRLKVGPKGQIVIPKILREKYGIRENDYVLVEAREGELAILKAPSVEEAIGWIRTRRRRLEARQAVLGELAGVDLEVEFEDEDLR